MTRRAIASVFLLAAAVLAVVAMMSEGERTATGQNDPVINPTAIVADDFRVRGENVATYEPLFGSELIFDENFNGPPANGAEQDIGRLVVVPNPEAGKRAGIRIHLDDDQNPVPNFREIVCHRLRIYTLDAAEAAPFQPGGGAGAGGGGTVTSLTLDYDVMEEAGGPEFTLLSSAWEDTSSGDVEFSTTKINTPTVEETITSTSLTLLSPHDPQLDRFDNPKTGDEDIELKYVRSPDPTISLTGGLIDPPPTVTTEIRITTDGGGTFALGFVVLEGNHIGIVTDKVDSLDTMSLWITAAALLVMGLVILLARRKEEAASA